MNILKSLNPTSFNNKGESGNDTNDMVQEDNGIINIVDFYPSPDRYHIVMELARG